VIASPDTAELALACDRVIVMRDGRASADVRGGELTEERLVVECLGLEAASLTGTATDG
jgi:ABC-type sugar transport system ATPase subunit